jgi:amino acid transporter
MYFLATTAAAVWVAARDVKISSQIMLWIEATSVLLISIVLAVVLWRSGMHIDLAQLHLSGASWSGVRLGVVLAVFSFVGFESATALGEEAREPLKTIPRAVLQSALLTGLFFVVSVYAEVVGFAGAPHNLGASTAPLREISARYGLRLIGPVIDAGVLVSMFACTLACVTAASRVSMLMAQHGLAHKRLGRIHKRNATPASAVAITGLIAVLPPAILAQRGSSPADIYGWMGTLAVFGFLTTYGLAAIALPVYLRRRGRLTTGSFLLAAAAACVTVLLMLGTLYPLPPAPFRYFPFIYALYLGCGLAFYGLRGRRSTIVP